MNIDKKYGGLGLTDFRYNTIITEELEFADCGSVFFSLGNDIVLPYFLHIATQQQKDKWLPKIAQGKVLAVCMSEPQAGSDIVSITTSAEQSKDGKTWKLNGRKMWISNGAIADIFIIVAYNNPEKKHKGMTLFVVEKGTKGFETAIVFPKIGRHAQDTALLTLKDVEVPDENVLGVVGEGFKNLMVNLPQERLSIGIQALASCRRVLVLTIQYCKGRDMFNRSLGSFQTAAFKLAEIQTEISIGQTFVDKCISLLCDRKLTTEMASMAKYWCTELLGKVTDQCLQLHGGYGYLKNAPIGRAFVDARVTRIYGGSNEVMKELIAKNLGFQRSKL
jgi:alkylation response protein AidB-like acyl-CoA dehydrogenase